MKPQTRRVVYSLAVLVWSAVMLYFYASGRVNKYLATDFRPLVLFGGLGLGVLGLFNLLTAWHEADCGHDHHEDGGAHDHERGSLHPLNALLLMITPVALSVAWTKDEYSVAALSRKGLYETPGNIVSPFDSASKLPESFDDIAKFYRKTPDGFFELDLMELFFATGDRDFQSLLDGLKVQTVGRLIDEKIRNPNGSRMRLYRLFITCCAADSRAIPIILEFTGPVPDFPDNSWVKVSGTMRFPMEEGAIQPVLMVEHLIANEPPPEENFMRK